MTNVSEYSSTVGIFAWTLASIDAVVLVNVVMNFCWGEIVLGPPAVKSRVFNFFVQKSRVKAVHMVFIFVTSCAAGQT